MKRMITALITVVLSVSSTLSFADAANRKARIDDARNKAVLKALGTGVTGAVTFGTAGKYLQLRGEVQSVLHVANFLYSIGVLADSAAIQDFGPRALIAGSMAAISTNEYVKSAVHSIAGVGNYIKDAGQFGEVMTAIALYKLSEHGYEKLRDNTALGRWIISDSRSQEDIAGE